MQFGDYSTNKLMKAADVPQEGYVLTIERFEEGDFGADGKKPIVFFKEMELGVTLNKTRLRQLREMANGAEDMDVLIGHQLILFPITVQYNGGLTPSMQFRAAQAAAQPVAPAEAAAPASPATSVALPPPPLPPAS